MTDSPSPLRVEVLPPDLRQPVLVVAFSGWISRTTERVEMLTIRFDSRGILKDFEYRFAGK